MSFTLYYPYKVKIHLPSLCVICYCFTLSQRLMTTGQPSLLISLPTFALVYICKHWLFTMEKTHLWICVLAQIWPFVSDEFELLIDYLSNLYVNDQFANVFCRTLGSQSALFFLGLCFLCCVVL